MATSVLRRWANGFTTPAASVSAAINAAMWSDSVMIRKRDDVRATSDGRRRRRIDPIEIGVVDAVSMNARMSCAQPPVASNMETRCFSAGLIDDTDASKLNYSVSH